MEPESAAIIDSWGWVLYRKGRSDEALGHLERAYETLRDPEVAGHIVVVLLSLERSEEARKALDEALVLFPESEILRKLQEQHFSETP
jgi:tetratricopeptide (TPR) repeat protein